MPSIFEVAKQAGVSASTVSRTFNSPHLITDKTKKRVLEAAEQVNYRPPRSRAPRSNQEPLHATLGFHFFAEGPHDKLQRNAFYSQVLAGALSEAADLEVQLVLSSSCRHDSEAPLPRALQNRSLAGALLVGAPNPEIVKEFTDNLGNLVFVDSRDPSGEHDSIVTDNFSGALAAAQYLIGLGHRRIGFVSGLDDVDSFIERMNGYVCAHFQAGLPFDRSFVLRKHDDEIYACLRRPDRPTAFMGANDESALVVLQICQELGLHIPRDVSLVGFDDLDFAARMVPALTSVHVPIGNLGRLGVRRLYAKIVDSGNPGLTDLPSCSLVPVSLVVRASSAPPSL